MGFLQQDQPLGTENKMERPDGSFLLDMERLSLLVDPSINTAVAAETGSLANLRVPASSSPISRKFSSPSSSAAPVHMMETPVIHTRSIKKLLLQKTLSRKASQRGDRKSAANDDFVLLPTTTAASNSGSRGVATAPPAAAAPDKSVAVVLASAAEATATTPTAASASPCHVAQYRRAHGRRGAASPWLDPRRILLFFATLSSMGTIILLYFTLSMGKMGGGEANTQ